MKKLSKVLTLILALAMVLGMMTVGASAAFTDDAAITYKEATSVAQAIGVINGYPDGSFDPDGILDRAGAAKLITYLLMGKTSADALVGSGNFTDVPASHWAAGSIDYCVAKGFIAGMGDGTYKPDETLTQLAFGKLLLCALGYDAKIQGYEGDNWATNIGVDMSTAGLVVKGLDLNAALTREAAAQMILQALTANMVDYANRGTEFKMADGTTVIMGASKPAVEKWEGTEGKDYTDGGASQANETVQLCEVVAPSLYQDATPVNGQAGYTWKVLGVAAPASAFVVTESVIASSTNGTSIADLTTFSTTNAKFLVRLDANATVYVNGTQATAKASAAGLTAGNYYYDTANKMVKLASAADAWADINGNGVKIDLVDTDRNPTVAEKIHVTLYTVDTVAKAPVLKVNPTDAKSYIYIDMTGTDIGASASYTLEASKVTGYEGLAKDDVVTIVAMANDTYVITELAPVVGKVSAATGTTLTINGTPVKAAAAADTSITSYASGYNKDVNFYYDAYGYTVYAAAIGVAPVTDYLLVTSDQGDYSKTIGATGNVSRVVLDDGTSAQITVAAVDANTWAAGTLTTAPTAGDIYAYTKNADGSYNLYAKTNVDSQAVGGTVKTGVSAIDGGSGDDLKADANTKFVVYNATTYSYNVYNGYANVPSLNSATYVAVNDDNGYADIVFVTAATPVNATAKDTVYLLGTTFTTVYKADGTGVDYYTLPAIVNGKLDVVKTSTNDLTDAGANGLGVGADVAAKKLYAVDYTNGKLAANSMTALSSNGVVVNATSPAIKAAANGLIQITNNSVATDYNYVVDAPVYVIDANGVTVEVLDVNSYDATATYSAITVVTSSYGKFATATDAEKLTVAAIYLQK